MSELTQSNQRLIVTVLLIMVTALSVNLLSGYIRHTEAGLGCKDWPACYAQIDPELLSVTEAQAAQKALAPTLRVKQMHRLLAIVLVGLVLFLMHEQKKAVRAGERKRLLPVLLLLTVIVLSVVGPLSYLKTWPIIATANTLGGLTLFSLSWWLWLQFAGSSRIRGTVVLCWMAKVALVITILAIASGIWVSANFAAISCTKILTCLPSERSVSGMAGGFGLLRELTVDTHGNVIIDQVMELIHKAHRLGAVILTVCLMTLGFMATSEGGLAARIGLQIILLLIVELALGVISILWQLPIVLVLGHYLLAALILLSVIHFNVLLWRRD